ncbi:hypothetical protein [Serratia ureilytica]|uniref:hypothetical protein n=1 Tax=Serratia ureilytica TaxID=300181 RepID=UPI0019D15823|nr:hypothetical protein [Serratia ureilytica]MBN5283334.1 hypothetical protein [Serratia ureilytica]MBN5374741.1 hypothetical protein [Serratia ureilytica]
MTLTTEQIQDIYEAAVHVEAVGDDQDAGFELLCKLDDVGGTGAAIRKLIDMLRAANREAQPVQVTDGMALDFHRALTDSDIGKDDLEEIKVGLRAALCNVTAPPAPAYPERLPCPVHLLPGLKFGKGIPTRSMLDALVRRAEYEAELDAMTPEQKAENDARLDKLKELIPQPAVPGIDELRLAFERAEKESDDGFNLHKYGIGYADEATQSRWESWLACRAAIPVSSGYKFVPVEPTEDMIAAAMNCDDVSFNADETFCVNFGNIYAAMLAAAPEGGNGA